MTSVASPPDPSRPSQPAQDAPAFEWRTLPLEVLRVLRAASLIGPRFDAPTVAALVGCETHVVLERLQDAADLGVPLEEVDTDTFSLPPTLQTALAASLMSSLRQAWTAKLAQLRGAAEAPVKPVVPAAPTAAGAADVADASGAAVKDASAARAPEAVAAKEPSSSEPGEAAVVDATRTAEGVGQVEASAGAKEAVVDVSAAGKDAGGRAESSGLVEPLAEGDLLDADIVEVDDAAWSSEAVFMRVDPAAAKPRSAGPPPPPPPSGSSRARITAEKHVFHPRLEDAQDEGHLEMDFLAVAREAADRGEPAVAMETLQRAMKHLGSQPASAAFDRLRALARIELGRLQWQAAGPELGFTLAQALATLDTARAELGSGVPEDLAAELCQVIAGVLFDLGDIGSLTRAREELEIASRLLQASGVETRAARLLNDRAAVLMRLGDSKQAYELLRESRTLFQASSKHDKVALRELAETDHLTACLPLYAVMVPGRERDGYRMGLERAVAAETAFRALDDTRELARVWETMGQLERRLDLFEAATKHFEDASAVQRKLGDLTGLGRTTEGLSEVLSLCGREGEAIQLLRDSVQYNRDKGSLVGLFYNRRTFTNLVVRLGPQTPHGAAIQEMAVLLGRAEREVETGRPRQAP